VNARPLVSLQARPPAQLLTSSANSLKNNEQNLLTKKSGGLYPPFLFGVYYDTRI